MMHYTGTPRSRTAEVSCEATDCLRGLAPRTRASPPREHDAVGAARPGDVASLGEDLAEHCHALRVVDGMVERETRPRGPLQVRQRLGRAIGEEVGLSDERVA